MTHPRHQDACTKAVWLAAAALFLCGPARAGSYTYTTIDAPGAVETYVTSMDSAGVAAGIYTNAAQQQIGFTWANGAFTILPPPHPERVLTNAILSPRGAILMSTAGAKGNFSDAVLQFASGRKKHIPVPGAAAYFGTGINAANDVVGQYQAAGNTGGLQGFLYRNGVTNLLQVLNAYATYPEAVSPTGTVVGDYSNSATGPFHGFVYQNGNFATFDPPRSVSTLVLSVNTHGDIAGYFYKARIQLRNA